MDKKLVLPIGYKYGGNDIKEVPIAETGAEAEKIYTKKPTRAKAHTWYAKVLAVSIEEIGGKKIASSFLSVKEDDRDNNIPAEILAMPYLDAGSLLIQIQRECWQDSISNQRVSCVNCGTVLQADIDLKRIEIPTGVGEIVEEFIVPLKKTYEINETKEELQEYNGLRFNKLKFRVATMQDAINRQGVLIDEIQFWKEIAVDTFVGGFYEDGEEFMEVPEKYFRLYKGKLLFNEVLTSMDLKNVREKIQTTLPSAKYYYEEACYSCGKDTPFFAGVSNFFSI